MSAKFRLGHALALILAIGGSFAGWTTPASAGVSLGASYFTVTPCRVLDTRQGGSLTSGTAVPIQFKGVCNVPTQASAAAISITAVNPTDIGFLTFYPTGTPAPEVSYLNFNSGQTRSGSVIVLLSDAGSVDALPFVSGSGNVELVVDVFGYFANLPPAAVNDTYAAERDTTLNVGAATGVTSNDTLNGASIVSYGASTGGEQTMIGTATPTSASGSITLNANGSFSYTPPSGAVNIDDTFKYILQNPSGTSTATVTIGVGKTNQTISFTSTAPSDAKVSGPTYTVTATATSGLPVAFTIDATAAAVCSISGSTVSFIGAGTCVINANQAGDSNYNPAPQVQQSFPVGKGDQTITFTSTAPSDAKVGGPTYNVTATATSGLTVTFSIDATAASVCSIAGSTVSFLTVGTCVINANQAGDANWNPASQVQQSFAVAKGDQTITYTSTAPSDATVNGPTYNVTATASSGLPVTFTIDASATSVCSIAGSTVSFTAAGTCVIDANQAGNANYNPAPQAQQSFAVSLASQTISFTSTAPANAKVGGPTYNVTATATSGLTVTFTIDASASTVCTIAGSTVSFIGAGTCVINANQAGDASYAPAPQEQQSFAVTKTDQIITFTSTAPANAKVNGPTYTVTATATSGLTVTFTIDASASTVCTIAGSTVSFIGAGTCVINANQAGDATWNPAPQAQQTFPVGKGDQTITFTSTAPVGATVAGPTYTVTATATSGLAVIFTIDASASTVCSISGSTVSFIGAGTCVINANQPGDANWNPAPQVQQSFPVVKQNQTITFTSAAPVGATVAGPTYTVTATATSSLPVTFTIDATASTVCSISGSTVSFIGAGTCVINANQAGNGTYNPAPQVQQSFPVVKQNQTITFTSTAPVGATVAGPTYTVTATATSGLPVTFTIDPSASTVCTIAGSTVSFIGAGTCVINANQAGDGTYNPAPQVQQMFPVVKQNQTITFTSTAPVGATVAGPTYTVTATATSGLPVTFTIDPSASTVCMISGSTVSFIGAGTCVINANQAGNGTYNPAPQVQQSFLVVKQDQTITFTSTPPALATIGGPTYTVTATATSGLTVAFAIDPSAASVCTIAGSTVSFIGGGTCVINANQAGNGTYNPAPQVQQSFHVNFPPTPIASPRETFDTIGNTAFEFKAAQSLSPSIFVVGRLKDNFTDGDGPNPLSVIAIVAGPTANGGTVDVDTNGEFTYRPKAGDIAASDSFSYQITDGAYTINRTVTINLKSRVWYVKNDDPLAAPPSDNGTSVDPFDTLAAAQTASSANDYIFVYFGDGTTTGQAAGITLKNGQHLIGQFDGLTITFSPAITFNGVPGTTSVTLLAQPSATFCSGNPCRPMLDNPAAGGNAVSATDAIPVEIIGLNLAGNTNGIDLTTTAAFAGSGSTEIRDNVIRATGIEGLDVNAAGTGTLNLSIHDNTITAGVRGIDVLRTAGTCRITAFQNNAISGNTGGSGIEINGAIFDAIAGNPIDTVTGGTTVIGASGNGVSTNGMLLTSVTGDLSFTDLDIFNDAGAGLSVTSTGALNAGAGTGFKIAVGAGVSTIDSNGGPAVSINNASVSLPINFLRSTNSTTTGLSLISAFGGVGSTALSAGSGQIADPVGASGTAVNISGGTGNITLGIPIINTSGNSIVVTGRTGDTVSFTGSVSDTNGSGISLTSNTGAAISFTGGLTASTGTSPAFTATGGGTVTVTGAANTLATTTGTALNVANTTIGGSGLTFRSITAGTAASGPTNGIVLNNTGALAGLTVSGTGANSSGGVIQKATGDGIALTDTRGVSLSWMDIDNNGNNGINGLRVNGLTLTSCRLRGNTNALTEAGLRLVDLTGTSSVSNTEVSGSTENNVHVLNNSPGGSIAFTNCTVKNNSAASGNIGIDVATANTGTLSATITGGTLNGNRTIAIRGDAADSSSLTVNVNGPVITAGTAGNPQGNQGIEISSSLTSTVVADVRSVQISGLSNTGINVFAGNNSNVTATVFGNTVTNTFVSAGASNGFGIRVFQSLNSTLAARVEQNNVSEVSTDYGILAEASGDTDGVTNGRGTLKIAMINNTSNIRPGGLDAIRIQARNTNLACAKYSSNTVTTAGTGFGLAARQADTATFNLEGLALGAQTGATTETYLEGQNPATSAALVYTLVTTNFTGVAANSCGYP